jgi:hypothetical protein
MGADVPQSSEQRPGIAVDADGGAVIDPTKNVLDNFTALKEMLAELRAADNIYQNHMREAETRRINELASQKLTFDLELAKILRANQDAAATLLATQLKEVKNDLSDRTAKLEQFRWESGGKSQGVSSIVVIIATGLSILIAIGSLAAALLRH